MSEMLDKTLFDKSCIFARTAIRSYLDGQADFFFAQAGISFELLGKAFLCTLHPSLIIDRDFDSLLQVCGAGTHSKRPLGNIRTIGAKEVLRRVIQLSPRLGGYATGLSLLIDLRNGVVHLGSSDPESLKRILLPFFSGTKILIEALQIELEQFYGEFTEMVQTHLNEAAADAERTVAEKLARARAGYRDKYAELDRSSLETVIRAIEGSYTLSRYEEELIECPACERLGIMSGSYTMEWEPDDWDETGPTSASPVVTLFPSYFTCKVCGLELDGEEELRAAEIEDPIEIEDVDPADFYQPDYDYYTDYWLS